MKEIRVCDPKTYTEPVMHQRANTCTEELVFSRILRPDPIVLLLYYQCYTPGCKYWEIRVQFMERGEIVARL